MQAECNGKLLLPKSLLVISPFLLIFVVSCCAAPMTCRSENKVRGERFPPAVIDSLVPEGGLEPPRGYPHRILSPLCVVLTTGIYKIIFLKLRNCVRKCRS